MSFVSREKFSELKTAFNDPKQKDYCVSELLKLGFTNEANRLRLAHPDCVHSVKSQVLETIQRSVQ